MCKKPGQKKDLLIIFGGASPEYFVSCHSAASLIRAVNCEEYHMYTVGITAEGQWLLTTAAPEEIEDGKAWLNHPENRKAILSPDRKDHGILVFNESGYERQNIDVVFSIIHGETGEDGAVQGLFEVAGIPYVGSGICASACAMDKSVGMMFADLCGIKRPEYYSCDREDYLEAPEDIAKEIEAYFTDRLKSTYPLFVKPASTGSSIGISKVSSYEELKEALEVAAQYPGKLVVEENIEGRELKVAVLGNTRLLVGKSCEIIVESKEFNDYALKYTGTGSHKRIPAQLPPETEQEMMKAALDIYRKMGCRGFARVDFFVTPNDEVVFNEINTVPGFSDKSIYSLMFDKNGISYPEVIQKLLDLAFGEK